MELWQYLIIGLLVIAAIVFVVILLLFGNKSEKNKRDKQTDLSREKKQKDEDSFLALKNKRGKEGELSVRNLLGKTVVGKHYVIHDITAKDDSGYTFDIDHVYINKYGIWVIETKNYAGEINGTETDKNWAYTLDGQTKPRYNPIKQNQTHIYRLSKWLDERMDIFCNVVVFVGKGRVHVVSDKVCYLDELRQKINTPTGIALSPDRMNTIYEKLLELREYAVSKSVHIRELQNKNFKYCPQCGTELVKSYSEDGTYLVCPNSMRCSYKYKIDSGWK